MSKKSFKLFPLFRFDQTEDGFEGLEDGRNHLLYRTFFWIGSTFIGGFALINVWQGRIDLSIMLGLTLLMVLLVNIYLVKTGDLRLAGLFYTVALICLTWFLVWHGGVQQTGILWAYPIMVIIISILGHKYGLIAALLLIAGSASLMLYEFPIAPSVEYTSVYKTRFLSTWLALLGLTWGIEYSRAKAYAGMRQFNARIEHASLTDQLTQVLNRRGLQERFAGAVNRFDRTGEQFSILLLDLDDFKAINDELGHTVGDIILQQFARLIQDQIRAMDVLGRWGGEEFVVLLQNADLDAANEAAENLRHRVADHRHFARREDHQLTVSIGVTTYQRGAGLLELTDVADHALYTAKKAGKNRVYSLRLDKIK